VAGIALAKGGEGGDDTTTVPAQAAAPSAGASPPAGGSPSAASLPPGLAECLADQGINTEGLSPQDIFHGGAVPTDVLNQCFESVYGVAH
jgi:hypothetical protein